MAGRSTSPAKLVSRTQIECQEQSLHSVRGAQQIISMITSRRVVYKLLLSRNHLEDNGCVALFTFLGSAQGMKHPISEIHLASNGIGNVGMLAIADYLRKRPHLKSLHLQDNQFTGDASTIAAFVNAINSSRLQTLNLASNGGLSDAFVGAFFPSLECPTLHHINLTATHLGMLSVPPIVAFLSSNQFCRLQSFHCSLNQVGLSGVRSIVNAIGQFNYHLTDVHLYSNQGDEVRAVEVAGVDLKETQSLLRQTLNRNTFLTRETAVEALRLLRYSRPLLLNSGSDDVHKTTQNLPPCDPCCSCVPTSDKFRVPPATQSQAGSPFVDLPTEIKQHILSFFAPTALSAAQRIRIYRWASLASTLPRLLPCLPNSSSSSPGSTLCIPDPSSLGVGYGQLGNFRDVGNGAGGPCAGGKCIGSPNSVVCQRETDRSVWLAAVGCDAYDPERELV
ncbi:RNI-like protein [Lyophyllum atratum]|nr:RNI-like protein [Lyophyllum atratum]